MFQLPPEINGYDTLCVLAEEDAESARALELLRQAMQETGVRMDDPRAVRTVGDLVVRLSFAAANAGGLTLGSEAADMFEPYLDTYDRWNELAGTIVMTEKPR